MSKTRGGIAARSIAPALVICLAALWAGAISPATAAAATEEELFKWGEYDSLIRVLEPVVQVKGEDPGPADSLVTAKSYLFLGVAFYATGKAERADRAFARAVELDPQVELDRFYVTAEIANRFQAIALRAYRRRSAYAMAKPLPRNQKGEIAPAPRPVARIEPARSQGHPWVWVGLGLGAAAAAAGSYFLLADHGGGEKVTVIDLSDQPSQ